MSNRYSGVPGRNAVLAGAAALVLFAATIGIGSSLMVSNAEAAAEPLSGSSSAPSSSEPVRILVQESDPVSDPAEKEEPSEAPAQVSVAPAVASEAPSAQQTETALQMPAVAELPVASQVPAAVPVPAVAETPAAPEAPVVPETPAVPEAPAVPVVADSSGFGNIAAYQQINPDVQGWLKIPGTNIDYPVLYNGIDVNYYLERDLYKQYSRNGVIWADPATYFGNSYSMSRNTILYGHNWTNYSAAPRVGSSSDVMFAQLTAYHYLDFTQNHPFIYYSTADQEMQWVVFACFYTDINFIYNYANPDDTTLAGIISGAKARSRHIIDVDVDSTDKILTLSTCTRAYGKSDQQRFVVMARLIRPGESFGSISMTTNPNPILPQL